jgi:hypothetical protein
MAGEKLMIWRKMNSVWEEVWSITTPTQTMLAQFSSGGTQFATVGQVNDRRVE